MEVWHSMLPQGVSVAAFLLASLGAACLGISKTGLPGLAILNVLIIADLFGAKASVGIILPMLILCDLIVFPLFRKHATWAEIWPLFWRVCIAIVAAWLLLKQFDDLMARRVIGSIILLLLGLQLLREYQRHFLESLPHSPWFLWGACLSIGVSTMLANAAGPIYSLYGIVRKMPKEQFLAIGARLFLLVNLFKVPFLGELDLINQETLHLNLVLVPALILGIFGGRRLVRAIPQRVFEILLYLFSFVAGVRLAFF